MKNHTTSEWSTHFYVGQVTAHEQIVTSLTPFLNDATNFGNPWIYSNCKSTCQQHSNSLIPWNVFYQAIQPNIQEYLKSLEPLCEYKIHSNEVWMNLYDQGEYQEIHDHAFPNRSFSCAYMLELPQEENCGGQLIFENPNFSIVQATGINRIFNAFSQGKFIPNIQEGTLVIFPSWASHYVLPNKSTSRRITISANFSIEGAY
jgi:hypothetical protein